MLKRLFDILFSICALIILLPVFIVISVLIKLDSKGPVFYRQQRVGLNGKLFRIFKFRTMSTFNDVGKVQITVSDDPRITSVGSYLRKYKLDELSQFINVVLGDMSVVGPRPEVPEYIKVYPAPLREKILSVRPGITDKASIEFRNENELLDANEDPERTYIEKILPIKQRYYSDYVDKHTMLGDVNIILQTIRLIFLRS